MAHDTWYRMDNVAKVFLASANERDTRSFRMSCTLKEEIEESVLKEAVNAAAKERPQYQVTILRGLFWHYMEQTDDTPVVCEENDRPCPMLIDYKTFGKLHYRVTYYHNRINLDFFHAIADGNGAIEFLNLIVYHYLKLKHPKKIPDLTMTSGASEADLSQDSFRHYYSKKNVSAKKKRTRNAYHLKGAKLPYNQIQFMEVHMSVSDILNKAHEANVSLTSYIASRLMMSIYKDMPVLKRIKPVTISMPVNLRNYYPSNTSRNFFNSVNVSHSFKNGDTFENVATEFNENLKKELLPEAVEERMYNYEKLENFFFIRLVPLFIKNPVVNMVTKKTNRKVTAVLSNLGRLKVPDELTEYIDSYCAFCSTSALFVVCSTYNDKLTLGISSAYKSTQVLRDFIKGLADEGVDITLYSTELYD
ncbi:MAG: hypothetical protein K5776_05925 [Lachnospiraceae bacterium]|nr:hypothetical protein [Lachnospiraceae bacterium]